jgi:hypothetical protein
MSVVEDVRQVLQDFISPELRALAMKMDNLEKRLDTFERSVETRFDTFERSVETRLVNQDKLAEARHNEIIANFETMKINLQLNSRLERLEAQQPAHSQ